MAFPDLKDRPVKDTICLFDVDETLTPARRPASPEMLDLLVKLRQKVAIGYVSLYHTLPHRTTSPAHSSLLVS